MGMCSKSTKQALPAISVALCTYNGAGFLEGQLNSLSTQSCLPTELVASDDLSDDGTLHILGEFSGQVPFPVRLSQNAMRRGISGNFEQAIRLCSGDFIALCDQDDVWLLEKLACFEKEFATGADWVCCDAKVVDAELAPLGYTLWQRVKFNAQERKRAGEGRFLEVLLKHYVVAGATLAFRADLRDILLPIPPNWHYDAWLAALLSATSKGVVLDIPLQQYRQHNTNVIGGTKRGLLSEAQAALSLNRNCYYRKEVARWSQLAERLMTVNAPAHSQALLAAKIDHLKRRAALPQMRLARFPKVVREIAQGNYGRFSRNWGSIVIDLLGK